MLFSLLIFFALKNHTNIDDNSCAVGRSGTLRTYACEDTFFFSSKYRNTAPVLRYRQPERTSSANDKGKYLMVFGFYQSFLDKQFRTFKACVSGSDE